MTAAVGLLLSAGMTSACVSGLLPGQAAQLAPADSAGLAVTASVSGKGPMLTAADQQYRQSPLVCCGSGGSSISGHCMMHACGETHELGLQVNTPSGSLPTCDMVVDWQWMPQP